MRRHLPFLCSLLRSEVAIDIAQGSFYNPGKNIQGRRMRVYRFVSGHRLALTVILALAGIGIMAFYAVCDTACSYLRGDIFGLDLKYVGVLFMAVLIALSFFHQADMLRMFVAAGIGVEIYLVAFQIEENIFCPFCLAFGVLVILMYIVNYERRSLSNKWLHTLLYAFGDAKIPFSGDRRHPVLIWMIAGYLFVSLSFTGSAIPLYAVDAVSPSEIACGFFSPNTAVPLHSAIEVSGTCHIG